MKCPVCGHAMLFIREELATHWALRWFCPAWETHWLCQGIPRQWSGPNQLTR